MESSGVILAPSILGPNPGLFIMRIWQGVVEVCLRVAIAVFALCTVGVAGTVVASSSSLDRECRSAGLFVVVFACLVVVVEVAILVVRFFNIGIINLHMRKFFIADIVVSLVLVVGFVVSGLTQAVCGGKLKKSDEVWWKETAAATVLSFMCAVLAGLLALWSLLFIVRRWYYKILQYMSLP